MRLLLMAVVGFVSALPVGYGLQGCSGSTRGGSVLVATTVVGLVVWLTGRVDPIAAAAMYRVPPVRAVAAILFSAFPSVYALLGGSLWGILGGAIAYLLTSAAQFDLVDRWAWIEEERLTQGFNTGRPSSQDLAASQAVGWGVAGLLFFTVMASTGAMTWVDSGDGGFSRVYLFGSSGDSIGTFAGIAAVLATVRHACALGVTWLRFRVSV